MVITTILETSIAPLIISIARFSPEINFKLQDTTPIILPAAISLIPREMSSYARQVPLLATDTDKSPGEVPINSAIKNIIV